MNILRYLSSTLVSKIKKNVISDSSKILGGANSEAEQNYVDSYYHS
jgi:hypothetical protein